MDKERSSNKVILPELLAPAGEWNSLVAAVQNGADAVYLGANRFSARQDAVNFSPEQIAEAVEYAHIRGVRLYVTVNTLIADSEMDNALRLVEKLVELGIDGIIVQDLGFAVNTRIHFPQLPLHGSTQMTIHNLSGLQFLAGLGFTRVVVAREQTLTELDYLAQASPIEVEAFVHGALCFSYSGKCLLSSLIGGRSGNRGRCAQPCRLEYSLVNEDGQVLEEYMPSGFHLLSPKDLCTLDYLDKIVKMGVRSLKIEGRMKRPEYVATVVKAYRTALDLLKTERSSKLDLTQQKQQVEQVFNRGFTSGYLFGNQGREFPSYTRPSNQGVLLGEVVQVNKDRTWVKLVSPVEIGDGLEILTRDNTSTGCIVRTIQVGSRKVERAESGAIAELQLSGRPNVGDTVYKTREASIVKGALSTFKSQHENLNIPVTVRATVKLGQPVEIVFCDQNRLCGIGKTDFVVEKAERHPLTAEDLLAQVNRLGHTPFTIVGHDFSIDPGVMVPKSELNKARRMAVERLMEVRSRYYAPVRLEPVLSEGSLVNQFVEAQWPSVKRQDHLLPVSVVVDSWPQLEAALAAGAGLIYLADTNFSQSGENFGTGEQVMTGIQRCLEVGSTGIYLLPSIAKDQELNYYRELLKKLAVVSVPVAVGDWGMLQVARDAGVSFTTEPSLNSFNRDTVNFLHFLGANQVCLSPELTLEQVRQVAAGCQIPLEYQVQGALPVMISEHCVPGSLAGGRQPGEDCTRPCRFGQVYGLRDRLGKIFPIRMDRHCRMYLFNSVDLCLIEHLGDLYQAGISRLRIEGRLYSPEQLNQIVQYYVKAWQLIDSEEEQVGDRKNQLSQLRQELEPPQGITKGHLFRGVIS